MVKNKTGLIRKNSRFHWLKLALKVLVTGLCIWYITGKTDIVRAGRLLADVNLFYLLAAFLFFILSKLVSAIRLNIYFSNLQLSLTRAENFRLYWLGMFYNLFLPGAISGDIYKVILLAGQYKRPYKQLTAAVLLDRFSGLLGLGAMLALISFFTGLMVWLSLLISAAALTGLLLFYFIVKKLFPAYLPGFSSTFRLGIAVQFLQVGTVYLILCSLGINGTITAYLFIFLVSSAVAVLPLTIGGLGIRELVFVEGAALFQISTEKAVLISLIFYLITLLTSAAGGYWLFRNPLNEKGPSDEPLIS